MAKRRNLPAISTQIRKLEEELGAPVFDRSSKDLSLTQTGFSFCGALFF